jgi:hypothetical protein
MDHWIPGIHMGAEIEAGKETLKSWAKLSSRPLQLKVKEKKLQLEKIQGDMETKEVQQSPNNV